MSDGWSADYLLSFVTLPNVLGATGALFYVISMSMKTAIPLRVTSLVMVHFGPETATDVSGAFELCATTAELPIRIDAPGQGSVVIASRPDLEVVLRPNAMVTGKTVGVDGKPISGVQVNLWTHDRGEVRPGTSKTGAGSRQLSPAARPGHVTV